MLSEMKRRAALRRRDARMAAPFRAHVCNLCKVMPYPTVFRTVSIQTGGIFVNKQAGTSKPGIFCGARNIAIVLLIVFFAVSAKPALGSTGDNGSEPEKKGAADAGKPAAGDKASSDSN